MQVLKDQGQFEILDYPSDLIRQLIKIERAGRTCYQSCEEVTEDTACAFVRKIMMRGHESVIEHSSVTVQFNLHSRGMTHEQVRHRLTAISQESTRYVDYAKFGDENPDLDKFEIQCVVPPHCDENEEIEVWLPFLNGPAKITPVQMFECYEAFYRALRKHGYQPQDARQWLPIGLKSQIVITANFREWRHIFTMRTGKAAHWEIRRTMCDLLTEFQKLIPVVFEDFKSGGEDKLGCPFFVKDENHWRNR